MAGGLPGRGRAYCIRRPIRDRAAATQRKATTTLQAWRHWRPCHEGQEIRIDVEKILVELRQERHQIDEAILSPERLARSRGARRAGLRLG
jgi:hypothetical protein